MIIYPTGVFRQNFTHKLYGYPPILSGVRLGTNPLQGRAGGEPPVGPGRLSIGVCGR